MAENEVLMIVDEKRFADACRDVLTANHVRESIGTYAEKTQHLVLKRYFEPDTSFHEIPHRGFIADIRRDDNIIEIQTSTFGAMRRKLEVFLEDSNVTVVYPVPYIKHLSWIAADGTISEPRLSPKRSSAAELLPNLIFIKQYLSHPHLHFIVAMLEVEEYRNLDGWGSGGKRGSTRYDRIPTKLHELIEIRSMLDLHKVLPFDVGETFSAQMLRRKTHLSPRGTYTAMRVLRDTGTIIPVEKESRTMIYRVATAVEQLNYLLAPKGEEE